MGAVRPASRMRPVELVDDDELPRQVGRSARRDAPAPRRAGRGPSVGTPERAPEGARGGAGPDVRRRWVAGGLVAAVVVGAAAVATAVTARSARERADAFGALPGVVRPLEAAPAERWRAAAEGPSPVLEAGDAVVTVSRADERWQVLSTDPATGASRWERVLVDDPGPGFESLAVACTAGRSAGSVLLCAWTEPDVVYGGADGSAPYGRPSPVRALDPATGALRGSWQISGRLLDVLRHEDDLVVATGLPDRRVLVERRAGTDGAVRWAWTSPGPLVDDGGLRALPELTAAGGVVALVALSTTLLDVDTGDVVEAGRPGGRTLLAALPGGGFATWESGLGGTLRAADGHAVADLPGLPAEVVGDATVDALLIDTGNRLVAMPRDGSAVTWVLPSSMSPVAVADGVVVVAGEGSVGAVDGRDGRLLWEQELAEGQHLDPLTDSLHVIAVEPDGVGGHALVARGLRDGVELWRVPLAARPQDLLAVAGRVVVRTDGQAVVLG